MTKKNNRVLKIVILHEAKKRLIQKAGKPTGTISHRSDGDYKKVGDGEWVKIPKNDQNNKPKESEKVSDTDIKKLVGKGSEEAKKLAPKMTNEQLTQAATDFRKAADAMVDMGKRTNTLADPTSVANQAIANLYAHAAVFDQERKNREAKENVII